MKYDMNVNGIDLISGKEFYSITAMKNWVTSSMRGKHADGSDSVVIVTLTVEDKITPAHFIKHKFHSRVKPSGLGMDVSYTKY